MNVLIPGYRYEVDSFESEDVKQLLQFIQNQADSDGNLETVSDGTTNEEVLEVLIDRMQFLNAIFPCRENSIVITHLETALLFLEKRTRDRRKRGVEGKHLK
jgi:hypothetical protein